MGKVKDLTGMRFGRLTVIGLNIEESSKPRGKNGRKRKYWDCKCDCGIIKPILADGLTSNRTLSCGCLLKETSKERIKQLNDKQWNDEEYVQMMSKAMSNRLKQQWKDEEYRQKQSEQRTKLNYKMWENEGFRDRMSETMKDYWQNEEYREAHTGENNAMYGVHRYGIDSPHYNSNITDEERENRRHIQGYDEWVYKVKEQANFTCDICGKPSNGDLCSHHLDAYKWNKERRLDITNGVCLCKHCHKEFHSIYGSGDNTEEDYLEYKFAYKMN